MTHETIIVWYRNDLRIHDHPALIRAAQDGTHVVPVFIFNDTLLNGPRSGSNRNRFLLESLADLRGSLQSVGADLVYRHGDAAEELLSLAKESGATAVYYTADYTPYSVTRDRHVQDVLAQNDIELHSFGGRTIVSALTEIKTQSGTPHKVFTPFYKKWLAVKRRTVAKPPTHITLPGNIRCGDAPTLQSVTHVDGLSPDVVKGGESHARARLKSFLTNGLDRYIESNNDLGADATSRLSAYLHFGCISPLEIEQSLPHGEAADAWRRQLAWSDFYNYVLLYNPDNITTEYQERYRGTLQWQKNEQALEAWRAGQTGYPVVDAAMRQLKQEGWMHNRARLIVGSFLTKDLWQDWREGELWFMKMLVDGDEANNNGNWQWIASVGVDPAPVFRRLYNPASQAKNYDPNGAYIRRYVPELSSVPLKHLYEPWKMSIEQQQEAGCIVGTDYPAPIVDHAEARAFALAQYAGTR